MNKIRLSLAILLLISTLQLSAMHTGWAKELSDAERAAPTAFSFVRSLVQEKRVIVAVAAMASLIYIVHKVARKTPPAEE